LGAGALPGNGIATNTVTVTLFARPVAGLFTGPWRSNINNTATVTPGLDGAGDPLAINADPRNISSTSVVQVDRSSLSGRVFFDRNGNGAQDGTEPSGDEGLGGVTITLIGTDAFGNSIARTTTTLAGAGATRGDFRFDDLPPGNYTLTETQPDDFINSPGQPAAPAAGGSYVAASTVVTSRWNAITLPLGVSAGPYLFPETKPGTTVSGRVFSDRNGNGALDVADAGIAGVTLGLYLPGTVCPASGPLPGGAVQTTVTESNGNYRFTGVPIGGSFVICQQQPQAHADRTPLPGTAGSTPRPNQIDLVNLPAAGSIDNDFPEALGFISGQVFFDHDPAAPAGNNNGARDAGDRPIGSPTAGAGVPVTLSGTPSAGPGAGTPIAPITITTAADGSWRFDDLLPGSYTVTQGAIPFPLGLYRDGINTAGPVSSGVPGAAGGVGDNAIRDIVLAAAGANSTDNRFAKLPRTSISGVVFVDANRDRLFTPADSQRLAGVVIELRQGGSSCADGTLLGTTSTAPDGTWAFPGGTVAPAQVVAGQDYRVCERQPSGWVDGPTLPGGSGSSAAPNQILITALPEAGSASNNFGEFPPVDAPALASISGTVFVDRNRDGLLSSADPGRVGGVVIRLVSGSSCSGSEIGRTTTDSSGRFAFPGGTVGASQVVAGGSYSICEEQPVGYGDGPVRPGAGGTSPAVNHIVIAALPAGGSPDNDFGEVGARLAGRVYLDRDDNGQVNEPPAGGDLGIPGVVVTAEGPGGTRATVTGPDGRFSFDDLPAGTWSLVEQATQPTVNLDGTVRTTADGRTTPGTGGGSATPVGTLPSRISGITLPVGGQAVDNLFGEVLGAEAPAPATPPGLVVGKVAVDAPFMAGQTGRYRISVRNVGGSPTVGAYTVADRLPAGLTLATVPAGEGWACTGAVGSSRFSCSRTAVLAPAAEAAPLEFTVTVAEAAAGASPVSNAVLVEGGGEPADRAPTPDERDRFENRPDTLPACTQPATHNACRTVTPVIRPASLAGRVWLDDNRDGRIDPAESGIPGVTVVLTGTDDLGRSVSVTLTTGPDGRYDFTNLRPGIYTVTEPTQPPGTGNGRTVPGSTGGTATGVDLTPSAISGIPLAAGQRSVDNNFGETASAPSLVVGKTAREARFLVGRSGRYVIEVRNTGSGPTTAAYTVTDRLPAGLTLAGVPAGEGWACTGGAGASRFSCSRSAVLAAGAAAPVIELTVQVADGAAGASPVSNAVLVEGGGEGSERAPTPDERDRFDNRPDTLPLCTQPPAHNACRHPVAVERTASLSGTVWLDAGRDRRQLDDGDRRLPGWVVELVDPATGRVIATTTTGPDGRYRFTDLEPGVPIWVRFRDPSSGIVHVNPVNGERGTPAAACSSTAVPSSCPGPRNDPHLRVVLAPGQELTQQSLPVHPTGSTYDTGTRDPLPGAVVSLTPVGSCPAWDPASQVAAAQLGGYVISGGTIRMTTGSGGFYQFVLLENAPAHCLFQLVVQPPPGFVFPSDTIPAQPQPLRPVGPAGDVVLVQPQVMPPTGEVGPGTAYHPQLDIGSNTPSVVNNHLPLDPSAPAGLLLSKTGDRAVAELGDTVRYSITVRLASGGSPRQVTVVDRLPAGFTYVPGTAMVGGRRIADPAGGLGPHLAFQLGAMPASGSATLQYRVRVGVGAQQGDGVNRATAWGCNTPAGCVQPVGFEPLPAARASNEGVFRIRVAGGAFGLEACVAGKVFVDCNGNHVQDREELGIPGVRLVLQDGTFLTSDSEGKYSMCGLPPKSHVLRIDELTLPRGSRLTTSSNRNLGDAGSLWLDLKHGELQRADFVEGSCSNTVLDQVKARRAQGEVLAPQAEKAGRPALRFDSKAHGRNALTTPPQGTDSANQLVPKERAPSATRGAATDERNGPTPSLPMNRPPPEGRRSSDAPDAKAAPAAPNASEARDATR
jgi:uncharacterized repeat protein (TIGR01451 family)